MHNVFSVLDRNNNGVIGFDEFVSTIERHERNEEEEKSKTQEERPDTPASHGKVNVAT